MLILLYQRFTLKPVPNFFPKLVVGITMISENGVKLLPQKRELPNVV